MNATHQQIASTTIAAATSGALSFPQIVGMLHEAGFESYWVDLRAGTSTYYLPSGEALTLRAEAPRASTTPTFDTAAVVQAIREAQAGAADYTYPSFCAKIAAAGCAGYLVSIVGRRLLYVGRTGETHIEHFPNPA